MENNENNNPFFSENDFSIKELKNTLNETNLILSESLKNRFIQDLIASMVFFLFNEFCRNSDSNDLDYEKNKTAKNFYSSWLTFTKKRIKKEILEINNKLKNDEKMNFLEAISNFSLPSTEDYQSIYDKALADVQKFFEKNTTS